MAGKKQVNYKMRGVAIFRKIRHKKMCYSANLGKPKKKKKKSIRFD